MNFDIPLGVAIWALIIWAILRVPEKILDMAMKFRKLRSKTE